MQICDLPTNLNHFPMFLQNYSQRKKNHPAGPVMSMVRVWRPRSDCFCQGNHSTIRIPTGTALR